MVKHLFITVVTVLSFNSGWSTILNTDSLYVCPSCNCQYDLLEFKEKGPNEHQSMKLIQKKDMDKLETEPSKKTIAFYLHDGVEILDFAGPLEVFTQAGHKVIIVSNNTESIISQGTLKIIPDYTIENVPKVDVVAFFGGHVSLDIINNGVSEWIQSLEGLDNYFSVCTGAFFLGEAGIITRKPKS